MSGLIENVMEYFDFSVHYDKKSVVYDKKGQYPLEFRLMDIRYGGVSFRLSKELIAIHEGPIYTYRRKK